MRSVTPFHEETEPVFPRPVGVLPVIVVVLTGSRELPLEISAAEIDLCPFVADIVDEQLELPIAFVRDEAETGIANRMKSSAGMSILLVTCSQKPRITVAVTGPGTLRGEA